jgi:hypothetical protein
MEKMRQFKRELRLNLVQHTFYTVDEYISDGMEVAMNQQANIRFSMEKGMKIMN